MHVAETGDAEARDGGRAVTGFLGRRAQPPVARVEVSDTGPAIALDGGLAVSGYAHIESLTLVHQRPRTPVTWPLRVGDLPREADFFQARAALTELGSAPDRVRIVTGMGGVGKSQLAARYARQRWDAGELDLLVWVPAGRAEWIQSAYANAWLDIDDAAPGMDLAEAATRFLRWLSEDHGKRWLIVLDDVTHPSDLSALWPPSTPLGQTVLTTRNRDAALLGPGRQRIDLSVYSPDEAVSYLRSRLAYYGRTDDLHQVALLAADFGYLPLALAQAVPYMVNKRLDCTAYRARLADHGRTLTRLLPGPRALPDDQKITLAAAWSLSIELADELEPAGLARPLLDVAAMLSPDGIPAAVLTSEPVLRYLDGPDLPVDDLSDALLNLHQLSLVEYSPGSVRHTLRVHRVLQRSVRDGVGAQNRVRLARATADALAHAWPQPGLDLPLAHVLRANLDALAEHSESALYVDGVHPAVLSSGRALGEARLSDSARAYFERVAARAAAALGPDHPDTFTARHELIRWQGRGLRDAGVTREAFRALLADRVRVQGPDHPDTLATRHELARWQGLAGDAAGARDALEELLADQVRVLGADRPDILTTRGNLARWQGRAGDAAGAIATLRSLVADRSRVWGPDDPRTLIARIELAHWQGMVGDAGAAASTLAELAAVSARVLGPDHPRTLSVRGTQAMWTGRSGDAAGAAATLADLAANQEAVLGADHPDTLGTRSAAAHWRGKSGDASAAAEQLADLVSDLVVLFGPDHPDTLTARNNLASWRGKAGDSRGAAAALADVVDSRTRTLGPRSPDDAVQSCEPGLLARPGTGRARRGGRLRRRSLRSAARAGTQTSHHPVHPEEPRRLARTRGRRPGSGHSPRGTPATPARPARAPAPRHHEDTQGPRPLAGPQRRHRRRVEDHGRPGGRPHRRQRSRSPRHAAGAQGTRPLAGALRGRRRRRDRLHRPSARPGTGSRP
nr:tetratricopeptide repeat protein [Micromonospora halophytica]